MDSVILAQSWPIWRYFNNSHCSIGRSKVAPKNYGFYERTNIFTNNDSTSSKTTPKNQQSLNQYTKHYAILRIKKIENLTGNHGNIKKHKKNHSIN